MQQNRFRQAFCDDFFRQQISVGLLCLSDEGLIIIANPLFSFLTRGFFTVATIVAIVTFKFVIEPTIPPTSGGTIESTASLTERTRLVALPSNGYSAKRNEDYVQRRIAQLARTPITHISVPDI